MPPSKKIRFLGKVKYFSLFHLNRNTVHPDKTKIQAKAVCIGLYRKFFSTVKNLLCRARRPDRIVKKL